MPPTEYHLILCDISGEHRPIAHFVSPTPFHSVRVGERFDDTGWERLDGARCLASPSRPIRYTVHSIKHLIEHKDGKVIVSYCLNLEPYDGPSSPIWGGE